MGSFKSLVYCGPQTRLNSVVSNFENFGKPDGHHKITILSETILKSDYDSEKVCAIVGSMLIRIYETISVYQKLTGLKPVSTAHRCRMHLWIVIFDIVSFEQNSIIYPLWDNGNRKVTKVYQWWWSPDRSRVYGLFHLKLDFD